MDVTLQTNATHGVTSRPSAADVSVAVSPQVNAATASQPERVGQRNVVKENPQNQAADERYAPAAATILSEEDISDFMIDRAFSDANRALSGGAFRLSYGVHEASNRITVAVYDSHTNELIREVPSESRLDLYARITEFTGLLFDSSS
jgi:flagellar protein FlaG